MPRKGRNIQRSKKKMYLRQLDSQNQRLFRLFKIVFTRNIAEGWESDIHPELNPANDFVIIARVLTSLTDHLNIDFWKAVNHTPECYTDWNFYTDWTLYNNSSDICPSNYRHFKRGNDIINSFRENDSESYDECVHEFGKKLTVEALTRLYPESGVNMMTETLYSCGSMSLMFDLVNKVTDSQFTFDDYPDTIFNFTMKKFKSGYDTCRYMALMNELVAWIDRFAHEYVEPSLIPASEIYNVVDYGEITYYSYHSDIYFRNNEQVFTRDDFNDIGSIPKTLITAWEFFKMNQDVLLKLVP